MSAACSACGDCCDPVWFPLSPGDLRQGAVTARAEPARSDLTFAAAHWRATGAVDGDGRFAYTCSAFDTTTRRCSAHETRPPICRGYPWYGREPRAADPVLPARCSHHADVPGAGAVPLGWPGRTAG